jgi:hypothetical protein
MGRASDRGDGGLCARQQGQVRGTTFTFLGFTHIWVSRIITASETMILNQIFKCRNPKSEYDFRVRGAKKGKIFGGSNIQVPKSEIRI